MRAKAFAQKLTAYYGPVDSVSTSYLSLSKLINIWVISGVDRDAVSSEESLVPQRQDREMGGFSLREIK